MRIVGLTGGMGSGKTTVGKMFQELGVPVYNSDHHAKRLMNTSQQIKAQLIALFGAQAYVGEELNRGLIANKVFNDSDLLSRLNSIVHPAVRRDFKAWSKQQKTPYVIQETALLFENKARGLYDRTIVVVAPKEVRIERLLKRDQTTREQIESRMKNQLDDETKLALADYSIENIDIERTRAQVQKVHQCILSDC